MCFDVGVLNLCLLQMYAVFSYNYEIGWYSLEYALIDDRILNTSDFIALINAIKQKIQQGIIEDEKEKLQPMRLRK